MQNPLKNPYCRLYLFITFGIWWGLAAILITLNQFVTPLTKHLTLLHPLMIFILYLPSITGLLMYGKHKGLTGIRDILLKAIPRKKDLFWVPFLLVIVLAFYLSMHYGSILFGIKVPVIQYSIPEMVTMAALNLFQEAGLIGGLFGWIGFLLPLLQGETNSPIRASILTGLIFGLWVLPGYMISSLGANNSYLLYVIQLMVFIVFQSTIFNVTKGNLFFYLLSFWLAATGSHLGFYYFNWQVQIMQIVFFMAAYGCTRLLINQLDLPFELQTFPSIIER